MYQTYLNCPTSGGAITAEEFAAGLGLSNPGCSSGCCQPASPTCPNCQAPLQPPCQSPLQPPSQLVCTCQTVPAPSCPAPLPVDEGCCCKQSFRSALQLLCDPEIAALLDFDLTAFFTRDYVAGVSTTATVATTGPADNLTAPLAGVFRRFSPCSCDLLDITAPLYSAPATATGLTADQVNLCELTAVVIQLAAVNAEGDLTAEQVAARNIRIIRRALARGMDPCACAGASCACPTCDDCCCASGLLSSLADNNLSRRVSLAAGPLLLNGVTLIGAVGNVLALVNEADQRFYFVCVNHIEFLA